MKSNNSDGVLLDRFNDLWFNDLVIPLEQMNDNRIQTLMRNDVHNSQINDLATNHSDEKLVIHNSQDQDVLCRRNNLAGWILKGVVSSIV